MKIPSGLYIDNPAFPLLQAHISYWNTTSGAGNAGGTTLVCADLANEPSYDGLICKILDGGAAGQARPISVQAGTTLTFGVAFTNSAGAVQQIAAGTRFVILTSMAGGGGPGPSPEESLTYYGIVDTVPGANQFTIGALAGLGAGKFAGATNPYAVFVLRDAGGASAAPQGEIRNITVYTTATGVFTTGAFTAAIAVGDEILIINPSLAAILIAPVIIASGTFDTSSATVPADSTLAATIDNFYRGHLLMPTAGTYRFRATRIVQFTNVGGIFTVDPNNPFPGATGLVTYVVLRDQSDFVPAGGGTNNRTPSDVIGMKDEVIPAMNVAPATVMTDTIIHHVKAILERVGATPADPDDSLLTSAGQRDATASLDDLSDVTTTDIQAKIRRILLRMSGAGIFSATIQGAARTELDTMLEQLATYFVAAGAALSVTIDPGGAARTSLATLWNDLGQMLAGAAGITTWPASAAPGNGISVAEAIRQIYDDINGGVIVPEVAETTGTFAFNEASALEQTVVTVALTARRRVGSIWLDTVNITRTLTVRLYHQIDGVTMRQFAQYTVLVADPDGALIEGFTARDDFRLTFQCDGAGVGAVNIPYAIE